MRWKKRQIEPRSFRELWALEQARKAGEQAAREAVKQFARDLAKIK